MTMISERRRVKDTSSGSHNESVVNLFRANVPINFNVFPVYYKFLYPLKTSENQRFSDVFRGYRNAVVYRKY